MKKFIALFFVIVSLLFLKAPFSLTTLSSHFFGEHSFCTTEETKILNATTVKNGNGFVVSCSSKFCSDIYQHLNKEKIQGESFCFNGKLEDVFKIIYIMSAKVVCREEFDDFSVFYAYSPKIDKSININSKKINLQIAYKNNKITVGTPLILGSF